MRALVLVLVVAALVGSFFLGWASKSAPAAAPGTGNVLAAKQGDAIRIPEIATRCVVQQEALVPEMLCDHTPHGRYEVVIFSDSLFVYKNGDPDHPRFAERWKP